MANIHLVDGGYNFLLIDGDVFLTGTRHPLSGMRPLSDPSWEIQFQSDKSNAQDSLVNIGWYWARPTPAVRQLFVRSLAEWDANTWEWDQHIMNKVRGEMIGEELLDFPKSSVLNLSDYKSTMLYDWTDSFMHGDKIDLMNKEGIMIHYTMMFNLTKTVVARQFGHWLNATYYTKSPKILHPINIQGTTMETFNQLSLAVHLAKVSGRAFMWPNSIMHVCPQYPGGYKDLPSILFADVQSVGDNVAWVEGMYLRNRLRYTKSKLKSSNISIEKMLDSRPRSLDSIIRTCRRTGSDVLNVDFRGLDLKKLRDLAFVRDAIVQSNVQNCTDCQYMWEFGVFNFTFAEQGC